MTTVSEAIEQRAGKFFLARTDTPTDPFHAGFDGNVFRHERGSRAGDS